MSEAYLALRLLNFITLHEEKRTHCQISQGIHLGRNIAVTDHSPSDYKKHNRFPSVHEPTIVHNKVSPIANDACSLAHRVLLLISRVNSQPSRALHRWFLACAQRTHAANCQFGTVVKECSLSCQAMPRHETRCTIHTYTIPGRFLPRGDR
ncbi:hypothetical protein IQ07DRAFT_66557 [Pyrenochaeta sp. DS3sAY3a]|nr:hypothetical protein IQ07DRAFT_66557 [Pyrenochaeta sp. DS3sAY3a]